MDNERIEVRAVLNLENLEYRIGIERIRGETIDRLGRNGNGESTPQQFARTRNIFADLCLHFCLSPVELHSTGLRRFDHHSWRHRLLIEQRWPVGDDLARFRATARNTGHAWRAGEQERRDL